MVMWVAFVGSYRLVEGKALLKASIEVFPSRAGVSLVQ